MGPGWVGTFKVLAGGYSSSTPILTTRCPSLLAIREPKPKVGLLISLIVDYLIKVKLFINSLSIMEYLRITSLSTLFSSLLKLSIKLTFYYRFFRRNILSS